jgi:hypothetical protein
MYDFDMLAKCITGEQIDAVLGKWKLITSKERIEVLLQCMGVEVSTFYENTDEDWDAAYLFLKEDFLKGGWRSSCPCCN